MFMNRLLLQPDEELLASLKRGDERALGMLYKLHFPMILHFILSNSGTEQEAKDIYQEAIIILYENVQRDDFELTCKIKTYIYSVCRRQWLKKLAEKSRYVGKVEDFESFVPFVKEDAEIEEKDIQFKVMRQAMEKLGEPCRTILEDFFIHDFTMQQITDKMGYTNADNAKNQKYKCLMRLKKIFFSGYQNE
ncbi:sigma-70 family RNA polymerase sigma factor [Rhodocytophaga rosea]|uniref:Sigma-70 family RNA polymerase sigma factor n=2 Tax=Rhodocytophaga rosea TaxID=2704465 RepID=A0A6C0GXH1_9BACT|nr:sigma-70 family RNA polymerase sigma factor [Rhodocytophaga rosea]